MRLPSKPDALENQIPSASTVSRDPSYPDRARIDSDVRAFLRPVSTPWIVFDRDSRVDDFAKSALRVGAVFASSPSFRPEVIGAPVTMTVAAPDAFRDGAVLTSARSSVTPELGMFPPSSGSPESAVEPSNLVVASDVIADSSTDPMTDLDDSLSRGAFESAPFVVRSGIFAGRRIAAIGGACAGVLFLALVAMSAVGLGGGRAHLKSAATTHALETPAAAAAAPAAAPAPVLPETMELDATPAPVKPAPVATTASSEAKASIPTDPKKRFGRLTIKADASHKNVWFDGKRMLGSGQRSFMVFCGMHTVAVNDKADSKDVEIPCNGEYVAK